MSSILNASNHSNISVNGNVAARDNITVYNTIPQFDKSDYINNIKNVIFSDFNREHNCSNGPIELFIDLYTDNLEQLNDGASTSNKKTILDVLNESKKIILSGGNKTGKSTALFMHILDLCNNDSAPIPIFIDAKTNSFCEWISNQLNEPKISDFSNWLHEQWMIRLEDLKKIDVEFIWDHMYFLALNEQKKVCNLIGNLRRWFSQAKHICTTRIESYGIAEQEDFLKVQILPISPSQKQPLVKKYNYVYNKDFDPSEVELSCIGDIEKFYSKSTKDFNYELDLCLDSLNDHYFSSIVKDEIGLLAWKVLINNATGLSFYSVAEIITRGKSEYYDLSKKTITEILSRNLLKYQDDKYYLGDETAMLYYSAKAFKSAIIRKEFIANVFYKPSLLSILNYVNDSDIIDVLCDEIRDAIKRQQCILSNDLSILEISFQLYEFIFNSGNGVSKDKIIMKDIIDSIKTIKDENKLSIARSDALEKLCAKGIKLTDSIKPTLIFKKILVDNAIVTLPINDKWEYASTELTKECDVFAAITPLTLLQFQAISSKLKPETYNNIVNARPEVWESISNKIVKPEYLFDPVVGISFENAKEICDIINNTMDKQEEVFIPSIGDWAFLDTDIEICPPVNTPPSSQNKPVACGISGFNAEGFSDVYGNVMEWTRTSWGGTNIEKVNYSSPYELQGLWDNDISSENYRILKGGSFLFKQGDEKCSCILPPSVNFPDVGLRLFYKGSNNFIIYDDVVEINLENI